MDICTLGCDLNMNDEDTNYLSDTTGTKYVLVEWDSKIDTYIVTAASTNGKELGVIDANGDNGISEVTCTVQYCEQIGNTIAKEMLRYGAKYVQTCNIY